MQIRIVGEPVHATQLKFVRIWTVFTLGETSREATTNLAKIGKMHGTYLYIPYLV